MAKNETIFRDKVALLFQKAGYTIEKEYKIPDRMRVDILAIKKNKRIGIEVKLNQRGISDDISKGSRLLQMPEFKAL